MTIQVAVCGPRVCAAGDEENAYAVGRLLARAGVTVLNGGGSGVMAAVSAGARSEGGLVVGVLPGGSREGANPDLTAAVVTNMGEARNAILVASADAVIVVGGSWGTLSELALAVRRGVPVVTLGGWRVLDRDARPLPDAPRAASSAEEAVEVALTQVQTKASRGMPAIDLERFRADQDAAVDQTFHDPFAREPGWDGAATPPDTGHDRRP